MSEWIKFSERLPQKHQNIHIKHEGGEVYESRVFLSEDKRDLIDPVLNLTISIQRDNVAYWMLWPD